MGWRTLAAILDAGTAACAAVNAAYFLDRLFSGPERTKARRLAILTLALISVASLAEAAALLAIASHRRGEPLDTAQWAAVRLFVFLGAAAVTALIARKAVPR